MKFIILVGVYLALALWIYLSRKDYGHIGIVLLAVLAALVLTIIWLVVFYVFDVGL